MTVSSTLIRSARLVPVGRPTPTDLPVDIRIDGATVTEIAPGLRPTGAETVIDADGRWPSPDSGTSTLT